MNPSVNEFIHKIHTRRPFISSLLAGGAIYHSIYNENSYFQAFISCVMPCTYVGYHAYKNKDSIILSYNKFIK